jgi:hypothetical protein
MTPQEMKANMAVFRAVEIETEAICEESGPQMADAAHDVFYSLLVLMSTKTLEERISPYALFLNVYRLLRKFREAQAAAMQTPNLN